MTAHREADLVPWRDLPPQNIEAEEQVLGAMMTPGYRDAAISQGARRLKSSDFTRPEHGDLFSKIVELYGAGEEPDPGVLDTLCRTWNLPQWTIEGRALNYCAGLVAQAEPYHWQTYVGMVEECGTRRELLADLALATTLLNDTERPLSEASAAMYDAAERARLRNPKPSVPFAQRIRDTHASLIERRNNPHLSGLSTGIAMLDHYTDGMQPGQLWTLAAPTSMGKSALAACVARHAAKSGAVLLFSLEMSDTELIHRFMAAEAHLDIGDMQRGRLDDSDMRRLASAADYLATLPIALEHSSDVSPGHVAMKARQAGADLRLVVVDYLQIMALRDLRADTHERELDEAARRLKLLATDLQVPVLMLSQLNRQYSDATATPDVEHLRGSGAIGQHSDVVLILHSPDYARATPEERKERPHWAMDLHIAKQRSGIRGVSVPVRFYVRQQLVTGIQPPADPDPFAEDTE